MPDQHSQQRCTGAGNAVTRMLSTVVFSLSLVLSLNGCSSEEAGADDIRLLRAAITLDVLGKSAVLYFSLASDPAVTDSIVEIVADAAQSVAIETPRPHRMMTGRGMTSLMVRVAAVPITPGGTLRFAPGGYTGVLLGLRRSLKPGDSVSVTVRLARGGRATALVPVVEYGALEAVLETGKRTDSFSEPPSEATGERLYRANGCAGCHGPTGHGDGPVAVTLTPAPRDFRVPGSFTGGHDVASIALTLAVGVPSGGSMPLYAHLTNLDRTSIALYIVSLANSNTR